MTQSAIILAGGFGTRLQKVVKDIPKPMADISGKPFLQYLLDHLAERGIQKVILSVGYKWESIRDYFGNAYRHLSLQYSVEEEPLGTGGAILKAVRGSTDGEFFIFNGDTFFNIDLNQFYRLHQSHETGLSIAMKKMNDFDRYGVVITDPSDRILSFEEKKFYTEGNINAGVYLLQKKLFQKISFPEKFSFEKDLMEKHCGELRFYGYPFDNYFIDIGIPEDYQRAQQELPQLFTERESVNWLSSQGVDNTWTLFLDRDGVINKKIDGDYVRNRQQFEWLPGVQEALKKLSKIFGRIIIVSNQQGVGKGLMTHADVESIHDHIMRTITSAGGRIDRVYFAPQLKEENSPMRKPGIGMALKAKEDFPDIDFSKSIMVGDSISDMEFGRKAGMKTVFITHGREAEKNEMIDLLSTDLPDFIGKVADFV